MCRTPDIGIGGIGLFGAVAVGEPMGHQPLRHLLSPTEFGDEIGVKPWLVDAQCRISNEPVAVEALNIVALVG